MNECRVNTLIVKNLWLNIIHWRITAEDESAPLMFVLSWVVIQIKASKIQGIQNSIKILQSIIRVHYYEALIRTSWFVIETKRYWQYRIALNQMNIVTLIIFLFCFISAATIKVKPSYTRLTPEMVAKRIRYLNRVHRPKQETRMPLTIKQILSRKHLIWVEFVNQSFLLNIMNLLNIIQFIFSTVMTILVHFSSCTIWPMMTFSNIFDSDSGDMDALIHGFMLNLAAQYYIQDWMSVFQWVIFSRWFLTITVFTWHSFISDSIN